jgi:putative hemolysin
VIYLFSSFFIFLFSFIGILAIDIFITTLIVIGRYRVKEEILNIYSADKFIAKIFPRDVFYFYLICARFLLIFIYATVGILFIKYSLVSIFVFFTISLFADFVICACAEIFPDRLIPYAFPLVNFYLTIFSFLFFPLTKIKFYLLSKIKKRDIGNILVKRKILEMINESTLNHFFDTHNRKILASLITFKEKSAREIMVPKIDIFALSVKDTIKSVQQLFLSENYSRIPVYKGNLDNIVGILMYKDVLNLVLKQDMEILNMPVENFIKPVLYSPESKRIPELFQELKSKQTHMAIIVNEYGGTEGIVTIEDILEELVGEIEDEYDIDEKEQYKKAADGSYVLDAKMSILDIEDKIGIKIPSSPEYETIGGYVFYMAGTIPTKGWSLHHDDFEMEVIASRERSIEKVRIKPMA